ncbi:Zinc finger C2H2-type, partial [Trinorchestia longiramus]
GDSQFQLVDVASLKCRVCGFVGKSLTQVEQHCAQQHKAESSSFCSICCKSFSGKGALKRHILTHTGVKPYECRECGYRTCHRFNLIISTWTAAPADGSGGGVGFLNHKCCFCTYTSRHRINVENHIRTHTGERPFKCYLCAAGFSQRSNLKRHIRTHSCNKDRLLLPSTHENSSQVPTSPVTSSSGAVFFCQQVEECRLSRRGDCSLMPSLSSESLGTSPLYDERLAYGASYVSNTLSKGTAILTEESTTPTTMQGGVNALRCKYCSYLATTWAGLSEHLDTHSLQTRDAARRFICDQCPYRSSQKVNLQRHKLIHTGDKPYACPFCPHRGRQKIHIDKHIAVAHKELRL